MTDRFARLTLRTLVLLVTMTFAAVCASPASAACGLDGHHGSETTTAAPETSHGHDHGDRPDGLKAANCAAACAMLAGTAVAELTAPDAGVSVAPAPRPEGRAGAHAAVPAPPPRLA